MLSLGLGAIRMASSADAFVNPLLAIIAWANDAIYIVIPVLERLALQG